MQGEDRFPLQRRGLEGSATPCGAAVARPKRFFRDPLSKYRSTCPGLKEDKMIMSKFSTKMRGG
ncbi:hypothetical protein AKJ37_06810 [candidate division MSBL1 archaeon SCGC-AAA259I09]|uniref:Uncharacterized protein n=2 Tax=candidate division MSBL1 TaxID=215777 RepID=A0A133UMV6_9EURY|nr:hypothetical protein AKJ37_06810 [candidate division MSBL1 archaeon SCGC-AAA259I09]KXA95980.1 hypothetical protein AKJ39_05240 [candidate division MSBL1 archaeon SCGC-AAA259J03]